MKMPFVIYSRDKMQFMKMDSILADPKWTTDIAEAMYSDNYNYATLWWDVLNNCQILELVAGVWTEVTR
jgi:hypothetical protein